MEIFRRFLQIFNKAFTKRCQNFILFLITAGYNQDTKIKGGKRKGV
jgi:hypothetical protein